MRTDSSAIPAATPQATRLEQLACAIDLEVNALQNLIEQLRAEQRALVTISADAIESSLAAKQAALGAADQRRHDRTNAMEAAGIPRDPIAAELRLAKNASLATRWRALRNAAREATLLNSTNGKLVTQRLQSVSSRLEALRGAAARERLYDSAGRTGDSPGGRVIAAA
ncbi:MAG: flagellar protein FlgN [Burkholderiales bacterium]